MIHDEAPVEVFENIDSTQAEARRRAGRGEFGPVWLLARHQIAGRGRRGRTWHSGEGNLLATYLCHTTRLPGDIALMGLAAGVAIADAMEALVGPDRVTLKWPNDVLIDGAKAAGILIDSGPAKDGAHWAALAFGVNLATAPEGLDQPAASVLSAMPAGAAAPEPRAFLDEICTRLLHWDLVLAGEGFAPLRDVWLARAHGLGGWARVAVGDTILEGRIAGLSERGELELDTNEGLRRIAAGEILLPDLKAV
jgi:BirA family biotin operon repressor/biotin-[acetyl-CoA-carboxylase] ligase